MKICGMYIDYMTAQYLDKQQEGAVIIQRAIEKEWLEWLLTM